MMIAPAQVKIFLLASLVFSCFATAGASCASVGMAVPGLDSESTSSLQDETFAQSNYIAVLKVGQDSAVAESVAVEPSAGRRVLGGGKIVARVNGEAIRYLDVRALVEPGLSEVAKVLKRGALESKSEALWQAALEGLIDRRLLLQQARQVKIQPDKAVVKAYMQELISRKGSKEALFASLRLEHPYALVHTRGKVDVAALEAYLEEEETIRLLIDGVVGERSASFRFDAAVAQMWIGPKELRAYYKKHPGEFTRPESVRFRQIVVHTGTDGTNASEQAAKAARRIRGGEKFADVARELSQGPYASQGGLWERFLTYGQLEDPIADALKSLEAGQASGVIEVQYGRGRKGYHIVKLEARKAGGLEPFETAQAKIRKRLAARRRQRATRKHVRKLRARATISVIPLARAPIYVREN